MDLTELGEGARGGGLERWVKALSPDKCSFNLIKFSNGSALCSLKTGRTALVKNERTCLDFTKKN